MGMPQVYFLLLARLTDMEKKPQFWFNTKTNQVEVGPQSLALYRIGPFESFELASRAPEIVAERAKKIAQEEQQED